VWCDLAVNNRPPNVLGIDIAYYIGVDDEGRGFQVYRF
jgi:hypothetical protein